MDGVGVRPVLSHSLGNASVVDKVDPSTLQVPQHPHSTVLFPQVLAPAQQASCGSTRVEPATLPLYSLHAQPGHCAAGSGVGGLPV